MDNTHEVKATLTGEQLRLLNALLFPATGKLAGEEVVARKKLWRALILPAELESGETFEAVS